MPSKEHPGKLPDNVTELTPRPRPSAQSNTEKELRDALSRAKFEQVEELRREYELKFSRLKCEHNEQVKRLREEIQRLAGGRHAP